jgi:hypothetical protein
MILVVVKIYAPTPDHLLKFHHHQGQSCGLWVDAPCLLAKLFPAPLLVPTTTVKTQGDGKSPRPLSNWACSVAQRVWPGPGEPGCRTRCSEPSARSRPPPAACAAAAGHRRGRPKRQPVVGPVTIYQLSAPQGSAAPTRARKSSACRKFGESSARSSAAARAQGGAECGPQRNPLFLLERRGPQVANPKCTGSSSSTL